jgi:hypothetical protein
MSAAARRPPPAARRRRRRRPPLPPPRPQLSAAAAARHYQHHDRNCPPPPPPPPATTTTTTATDTASCARFRFDNNNCKKIRQAETGVPISCFQMAVYAERQDTINKINWNSNDKHILHARNKLIRLLLLGFYENVSAFFDG